MKLKQKLLRTTPPILPQSNFSIWDQIERTNPLRPYKRVASAAKHRLEPHSQPRVLRFFGKWEDGETRLLNIHFHLEDETIEIVEDHDTNCGRYKAPMFLKRCRLPKVLKTTKFRIGRYVEQL